MFWSCPGGFWHWGVSVQNHIPLGNYIVYIQGSWYLVLRKQTYWHNWRKSFIYIFLEIIFSDRRCRLFSTINVRPPWGTDMCNRLLNKKNNRNFIEMWRFCLVSLLHCQSIIEYTIFIYNMVWDMQKNSWLTAIHTL